MAQIISDICPITNEEIKTPKTLRCNHVFEEDAINEWLRGHNNCPLCGTIINRDVSFPASRIDIHMIPNYAMILIEVGFGRVVSTRIMDHFNDTNNDKLSMDVFMYRVYNGLLHDRIDYIYIEEDGENLKKKIKQILRNVYMSDCAPLLGAEQRLNWARINNIIKRSALFYIDNIIHL